MRTTPRLLSLACAAAISGAGVLLSVACAQTTAPTAAPQQPIATLPAQPQAPELVTGLPDFTRLVDRVGPGVVSIEAETSARPRATTRGGQPMPDMDQMPEFFRRMFPDGMPGMPGMPEGPRGRSMGTGFIISTDGYLLTNNHVVEGADVVRVRMADRREFEAKVVGTDPQSDTALLKIDASGLPALRMGISSALKPGQWVVAIGSPLGLEHSVTAGIVSAVGRSAGGDQRYVPFIQTDVAINRGNSGGPLLNTKGEVVGINSQILSNSGGYMGVSFAIPIDVAMNSVQQLKATGTVRRGALGATFNSDISRDDARALGLPDTLGALVTGVMDGSGAQKAGLRPGDVVRSVNGRRINEFSDLPPIIGAMAPGARVDLEVWRDGRGRNMAVTLGELNEAAAQGPARIGGGGSSAAPATVSAPLGIVAQDLDPAQRGTLGLGRDEGVRIVRVDGAAAAAGLRSGDIVLQLGQNKVASAAALDAQLRALPADRPAMLLVRRGAGTQFVTVVPEPR